jgi:acetyltransferase-like isoleucine patch superfamily enzyme
MVVTYFPGSRGHRLRNNYWKRRLKHLGANVTIDVGVYFQNPDFIEIEENCWIDRNVMILAGLDNTDREKIVKVNKNYPGLRGMVHIGKNVHIGPSCILSGISSGIYISDNCGLSANSKVYAFSHHYRSKSSPSDRTCHFSPMVLPEQQCIIEGPIFLGRNVGVALNCVILPGVSIPDDCFVTTNSVVLSTTATENTIISGNPARGIDKRYRLNKEG